MNALKWNVESSLEKFRFKQFWPADLGIVGGTFGTLIVNNEEDISK